MNRNALSMRLVAVVVGLSALALVAGIGLSGCQSGDEASKEGEASNAAAAAAEQGTLYTCPMHPEVVSNEPGECPTCGMDLVPVDQVKNAAADSTGEMKGD